jgi:hypothetical protein
VLLRESWRDVADDEQEVRRKRLLVALFFVVLLAAALGTFGAWELGPGTSHDSVREWVMG